VDRVLELASNLESLTDITPLMKIVTFEARKNLKEARLFNNVVRGFSLVHATRPLPNKEWSWEGLLRQGRTKEIVR